MWGDVRKYLKLLMIHPAETLLLLRSGAAARERRRRPRPTHVAPPSLSRVVFPQPLRREQHLVPPAPRSPRVAARALRPSSIRSAPACVRGRPRAAADHRPGPAAGGRSPATG